MLAFRPVLTLPDDFDAAERLGVDAAAYKLPDASHWVGGHVSGIQEGVREPGTVQFRVPAGGDWSQVTASGESC